MSKVEMLRLFLNERLTAAAEEIFGVVEKTIAEYQGEVVRLQSLLDFVVQPKTKQHKAELEIPPELRHGDEDWIENLRSEDTDLTQIKEELEELWTSPPHSYQAQKEENDEGYSLSSTRIEQIKIEPDEDYRESEPTTVSQTLSAVNPECSGGQSENSESPGRRENEGSLLHFKPVKSKRTKMLKAQSSYINSKGWKSTQLSLLKSPSHDTTCTCKVCGRSFHQMGSLFKHVQTHSKEKERCCGVCGKNMESTECMKDHLQTHIAARYCCHVCGKWFTFNSNLKTHMRSHTGEKPYCCPYCCKGFITGGDLKKHIRIHTGEKPFCCPDCGKSFTRSGHLKRHMKTHKVDK